MRALAVALLVAFGTGRAIAQAGCTEELVADPASTLDALVRAGCELTADQISAAMDNPVGEMISVPFSYERRTVTEPFFGTGHVIESLKLIPTFPVQVGDNWSLVNRVVLSFPKVPVDADALGDFSLDPGSLSFGARGPTPDPSDFQGTTRGFGDLAYVGLFTPRKPIDVSGGKLIWALGPTVILPTASEPFLGQGKYQIGPAGALAYLGEDWTLGLFPQHWWSVAGDEDRARVSRTNLQYFVYRKLPNQWSVGAAPTISVDWTAEGGADVDLPIGIGLNKTAFLGRIPVRFGVEYQTYVATGGGIAPENVWKFSITPALPAAFVRNR